MLPSLPTTSTKEEPTAAKDNTKLTARQAVERVLGRRKMTVSQITEEALPLTSIGGATPKQQFYSLLYTEAQKPDGLVVKAGDGGVFKLNPKRRKATAKA